MPRSSNLFFTLTLCLFAGHAAAQCSPASGPPPSNQTFNTASAGVGNRLPIGAADLHWTWAIDNITGAYAPAIVMDSLPSTYYRSSWPDCYWISTNKDGTQSGTHDFFYKVDFNLPCANTCGLSYDQDNTFCLSLDIFADNSISEIYVNGVPQSPSLGGRIPVTNPYQADGSTLAGKLTVSLCHGWKAGANSLVLKLASTAPLNALLVQASKYIDPNINNYITATTCDAVGYDFGSRHLTTSGLYYDTIRQAPRCDSIVALDLTVTTSPHSTESKTICAGSAYNGYTEAGTYTDTFPVPGGCDSLHTLILTVTSAPQPDLGTVTTLCSGTTLTLTPGTYLTYQWQDGSTLDHYVVTQPGHYSVTVTDACGTGSADIQITGANCGLYFPNAFTPNGDGLNDSFHILTGYTLQDYHLEIHDRWGKKIFETNDQHQGWNGQQPTGGIIIGNYVWHCRYTLQGKTVMVKGTVAVMR